MGALDRFVGAAQAQLGAGDLAAVTVESALAPTFTIRPFDAGGAGDGSGGLDLGAFVGFFLRPKITVQTPAGPLVVAPYGDPPAFPWAGVVFLVGAVATAALAAYGLSKVGK